MAQRQRRSLSLPECGRSLCQLGLWAIKFSPFVGVDDLIYKLDGDMDKIPVEESIIPLYFGLIIDLTGTEKLHGETHALFNLIRREFSNLGLSTQLGLAPTIGAAWALSRQYEEFICEEPERIREVLAPLPPHLLRIPLSVELELLELGIQDIAQLITIKRALIPGRYGPLIAKRINTALGETNEVLRVLSLKPPPIISKRFETPISNKETLEKALSLLLDKLIQKCEDQLISCRSFIFKLIPEDKNASPIYKEIVLNRATLDTKSSATLLHVLVESIPEGKIKEISIKGSDPQRAQKVQSDFLERADRLMLESSLSELLNTLILRLGRDNIKIAELNESFVPENSYSLMPFEWRDLKPLDNLSLSFDRPSHIFDEPEPIDAISLMPDKPPSQVRWRGENLKIIHGLGPERIAEEWWRRRSVPEHYRIRDYFKLQDSTGKWYWVFRRNTDLNWFLHGIWH